MSEPVEGDVWIVAQAEVGELEPEGILVRLHIAADPQQTGTGEHLKTVQFAMTTSLAIQLSELLRRATDADHFGSDPSRH
jgi:hypothetical protein